ncbi:MAG TPA: Smr/MutS family protein [Saprospiraceae bacterium]|nr:Smr/MutS family protein [Saprospiraceae bacterium]HNT18857.1 Smr/MutS family protein [Saprospiraceae bacterium]
MILVRPEALFQHLEFDKLNHSVAALCLIEDTRSRYFPMAVMTSKQAIDLALDETLEFKSAYERNSLLPVQACPSISESLKRTDIQDYVFDLEALVHLFQVVKNLEEIALFFRNPDQVKAMPLSIRQFERLNYTPDLYREMRTIFDDSGQIRPDATPELKIISRAIRSKEEEIDQVFRSLLNEFRKQGWLSESGESVRNNRRVVAVQSEYKRRIKGIIHDESTTGRTTFIEPERIIEKNNELFDLEMDYQKEIYRILQALSKSCRQHADMLRMGWEMLLHFDFIRSKAIFAVNCQAYRPEVTDRPQLKIKAGRHPLLFLKNKGLGRETVPFDLILTGDHRVLILSGPNAGGKSVAMKAVGLIQLMAQSGMLIPAHEASEMGVFHHFLGDIGDQQSLEDDLSTYSSRLLKMKQFLEVADDRSLVLIDEFGSGTDPKLGGAIAEAILLELNKRKVYGVITTHYSNLKVLAFKTRGLLNGAMIFDTEHLKPTFQLRVGRPGSSYAFEVASRSGLSPAVIEHARKRTHEDQKELEDLLIELQKDKLVLQEQLASVKEKELKLDKLVHNYERLNAEFELKKKKFKLEQKNWELHSEKALADKIGKTLREIKAVPQPGHGQKKLEEVKQKMETLDQDLKKMHTEINKLETAQEKPMAIGSYVRLRQGSEIGRIVSIRKDQAQVEMGSLVLNLPLRDLVKTREPLSRTDREQPKKILVEEKKVEGSLDLRGMSKSQAIELLQHYLDRALLSNVHELRILHGKGNGILRDLVKSQARQYKAIKKIFHPPNEAGGEGISILQLE